jgi:hypothetical protein
MVISVVVRRGSAGIMSLFIPMYMTAERANRALTRAFVVLPCRWLLAGRGGHHKSIFTGNGITAVERQLQSLQEKQETSGRRRRLFKLQQASPPKDGS